MQIPKEAKVPLTFTQPQRDGYDLPAYDALAKILSDYLKMPKVPQHSEGGPRPHNKSNRPSELNQTFEIHTPSERILASTAKEDGPNVAPITEKQTNELENYRSAMGKMAEDILALRSQVASLEEENSRLHFDASQHHSLSHTLLDDTDTDVMTKAEIADRIVSLKLRLASESRKTAEQRDKIQQLQNELIRGSYNILKNDSENELVQMQLAQQQQYQAELQRYQGQGRKMADLEVTIRQQEKVIEKMEKVLEKKLREKNKDRSEKKKIVLKQKDQEVTVRREIESVLAGENSRLRAELERLHHQPPPVPIQQPVQVHPTDTARMDLLVQLERAEACIRMLDKQLEENARQWGREKQEMLSRLSEYDHGLAFTPSVTLHGLPLKSVSDSVLGRVRYMHRESFK